MITTLNKPAPFTRNRTTARRALTKDTVLLLIPALLTFLVHLLTSANYGFFRDELYYIDAGKHLSFGYVDFPSFVALLAALINHIAGDSLIAYHLPPALAGACLVLFSGLIARELGGGRFAQALAAIATLVAPVILGIDAIFSMDAFDELWWVLAVYVLILLIKRNQPRFWLLFALITGLGLLTKMTMLMFGFAIVAGLLLTPQRRYLASKWAWIGAALALAFLLPYVLWNAANGWPSLGFWHSYTSNHVSLLTAALGFLFEQIIGMNPLSFVLWLTGLYAFFFRHELKPYRALGWAFLILYVLFTLSQSKLYFLAPAYPMLFAAGALSFERSLQKGWKKWLKPAYIVSLVLLGAILAPIVMPLLPPATYGQTMAFVGDSAGLKLSSTTTGALPQQLADRFGWDSMAATVASVYHSLPGKEQAVACILTRNYGEAGAIDLYGPAYHLPHAISGQNTYYLWGYGNCTGKVIIAIGYTLNELQPLFGKVTQAGMITCSYCLPQEDNLPVYVAQKLKIPMQMLWALAKHLD